MFALGVLLLLHLYIGVRIAPQLPGWIAPGVFGLVLLASLLLIPAAFVGRRARRRAVADRWTWAGMLALGLFSMLLVATLLRDALLLVVWPLGWAADAAAPSAAAVPALALAAVLLGFAEARRTPRVHEVPLPIAGLPAALDGFTIVQITDLHVGPTVKAPFVRAVVEAVNRLDADVVAVTGDDHDRGRQRPDPVDRRVAVDEQPPDR